MLGAGADGRVADGEVEEDGRGHYGYDADAHRKADASLFEVGHHSVGGGEAVGAASAEDDGVGLLDEVKGVEEGRSHGCRGRRRERQRRRPRPLGRGPRCNR